MASLVPGFEHDVFVSYATVDNRPENDPWIDALVARLQGSLAATSGKRILGRVWWDKKDVNEEELLHLLDACPANGQLRFRLAMSVLVAATRINDLSAICSLKDRHRSDNIGEWLNDFLDGLLSHREDIPDWVWARLRGLFACLR